MNTTPANMSIINRMTAYLRKYRFVFTNDEILPCLIPDQWKVHHFRTDMVRHSWMQDEERTFLENPQSVFSEQHYLALQEVRAAVGLEGLLARPRRHDCGL